MKKLLTIQILTAMIAAGTLLKAQDMPQEYLGLPGDNLNLYAVMQLFQESKTLEEFEKGLNDQNSMINNLDLNGDNFVDYLMVIDNVDGNVHNIVIRDALSPVESQDVAVIVVQRFQNGQVQVQLIGDEDLYGRNYIIEPIFDNEIAGQTPNPGYTGNNTVVYGRNITVVRTTPVIIASWPVIRFIYSPRYVVWRSRWHWDYYPVYWSPWTPYYWHYYYGYHYNWYNVYYGHYRRWSAPRYTRWNDYYYVGLRKSSPVVKVRIQSGNYRTTYNRPESRKEGEALYTQSTSGQGRRSTPVTTSNSTVRRSTTNASQARQSTVATQNRRSVSTGTSARPVTTQRGVQSDNSARRPTTVTTTRSSNNTQKSGQSTVSTNRRTSANVSPASTTRTRSTQSVSPSRNTKSSGTAGSVSGSNSRRSTNNSKAAASKPATSNKSGNSRNKETTSSTRRK